jgi:hypothetical protein
VESTLTTPPRGISSDYEVGKAPPEAIQALWPQISDILNDKGERMLEKFEEGEILTHLFTGRWDIWLGMRNGVVDGFTICQWDEYSKVKHYLICMTCGEGLKNYFKQGMDKIEKYAALSGAQKVKIQDGRPGWERMLKHRGYGEKAVTLSLNVRKAWSN